MSLSLSVNTLIQQVQITNRRMLVRQCTMAKFVSKIMKHSVEEFELFCAGDYSFSRKPVSSLCFTCLCLFLLGMVKDGTRLIGNGLSCCQKLLFFYGSQHACPNILTDAKHGVCYSDNTKVAWPGHDDISD